MDGLTMDREEILAAARRLREAASTPWHSVGACTKESPVLAALERLGDAWSRGHAVLVADAQAARDSLLAALEAYAAVDEAAAERLRALGRLVGS